MDIWNGLIAVWPLLGISTIVSGIVVAVYGPLISDIISRRRLRRTLYQELAYIYEYMTYKINHFDDTIKENFFSPSEFNVGPEQNPQPKIGNSIFQSQINPQIWRGALKGELDNLRSALSEFKQYMIDNNLYNKILADQDDLKHFYQLKDSYQIAEKYNNIFRALSSELSSYEYVPRSPFLTKKEATELSLLEYQFDMLKIANAAFDFDENEGYIDAKLLNKMRRGRAKGTLVFSSSGISRSFKLCIHCNQHVIPEQTTLSKWFLPFALLFRALTEEQCSTCKSKLLSFENVIHLLSTQLVEDKDQTVRSQAAQTLGELCKFRNSSCGIGSLLKILKNDNDDAKVRAHVAEALGNIGTSLVTDSSVTESLINILQNVNQNSVLRLSAASSIGKIYKGKGKDAPVTDPLMDPLIKVLKEMNDNADVRVYLTQALGDIGNSIAKTLLSKS